MQFALVVLFVVGSFLYLGTDFKTWAHESQNLPILLRATGDGIGRVNPRLEERHNVSFLEKCGKQS